MKNFRPVTASALGVLTLAIALVTTGCGVSPAKQPEQKTRLVPHEEKIAQGQVSVQAGKTVTYRVDVTSDMAEPASKGTFSASGGGGNDVQVAVADAANMSNWVNDHQATVLWETPGKQTMGTFNVPLSPGTYYLTISNRFSIFSDKSVVLDAGLNYLREETGTP